MGLIARLMGRGITCAELHRRMARGEKIAIIDVRTPEEFDSADGRIPGARLMPVAEIRRNGPALAEGLDGPAVTVCSHGLRSRLALRLLGLGGDEHYSLKGGMKAWRKAGYDIVITPGASKRPAPAAKSC